ncbi:MAG: ATPase, T2SS/T4P/T4SS family, partial [Oscillospiraceae bacterium]
MKNLPIGEILVLEGVLTRERLEEALKWQKSNPGKRLGDTLIDLGFVSQREFMKALERRLGIPFVDLYSTEFEKSAIALVPEHFARQNSIIPISKNESGLKIATNDPLDFFVTEDIRLMTGLEIQTVIATKDDIKSAIDRLYSNQDATMETNPEDEPHNSINLDEEISNYANSSSSLDSTNKIENAPIVKLVNTILIQAYRLGASDVHIEPNPLHTKVRLRIDGDLMEQLTISPGSHSALVSRIKILGGMNIAEKRVPQDGRFDVLVEGSRIDVRVSTLPVVGGEKVVIRLLGMSSVKELDIQKVGLIGKNYEVFQKIIENPYGLILITGPTGSGKTTTLYSALSSLIDPKINIITVEDPVEKHVSAISQVQVNVKSGLTFADGLRS